LAFVEDCCGPLELPARRHDTRPDIARTGNDCSMLSRWILLRRLLGKIVGNDQRCDGPLIERNAMRTVDEMPNLRRVDSHLDVFVRDVLEECDEVDFLLIVPAEPHPRLLTDDREHGLV